MQVYPNPVSSRRPGHALTVFLIVLAVLLAAAAVLSWMVLNDPNAGKGLDTVAPSDAAAKQLMQSSVTGKECSFSAEETNGFLAYLLQKHDKTQGASDTEIKAVAVADAGGDWADLYVPVRYKGKNFGVTLNVTPALSDDGSMLDFRVNSARVGRLPVPPGLLLRYAAKKLPADFAVDGDLVSCPSPSLTLSVSNLSGTLKISSLRMENGMLKIGAKTVLSVTGLRKGA